MIELKNVSKVYNNYNDNYITALRGINLKLAKTGLTFVVGQSGSGKSTLLNILSGLDIPTGGEMFVNGVSTLQFNASGLDGYRNNYVGVVYQDYNLLDHLTLGQNVALQLEVQGKPVIQKEISELFERLGIGGMEDRYPTQCSGGQNQRAAIARVLIKKPKILFADEPTAAVDQEQRIEIYKLLRELSKEILIIASSHSRELVDRFADRVITLNNGQIFSDNVSGDDKSSSEVFCDTVMAVEPGVTLNYEDIDRLNKMIDSHNKKGTKGVFICIENDAEKVEKHHPVAAKQMQAAIKTKQKNKIAQKETRIKSIMEEPTGVFQFEATKLPFRNAWGMSLINLRSNKLRSIFTILLSVLAVTFFALSANISTLSANRAVMASFSDSNAKYLTVSGTGELFTLGMKDEWTAIRNSSGKYDKTSLVYDFGSGTTMSSFWGLSDSTQVFSVSKLAVIGNADADEPNAFGYAMKKEEDGTLMGKWPTAANEIAISDFVAAQLRTALFAAGKSVPHYSALYDPNDASGYATIELERGAIAYKISGIYDTNFEHYFEFGETPATKDFFTSGGKGYFNTWEMMRLKNTLTPQERKQAEYLLQHDFVTGFVAQNFVSGIMDGMSVGGANGVLYNQRSSATNIIVGNAEESVGSKNYFMTLHPNGYATEDVPGLYANVFGSKSTKGLELSKGTWTGGANSIKVSRGFYEAIMGGQASGANTLDVSPKRKFAPVFAKKNVVYNTVGNSQSEGNPDEEIIVAPHVESFEVLWNTADFGGFTVENTGVNAFPLGSIFDTNDYVVQFPDGANLSTSNYRKFVEYLVLPTTSFIVSNQYSSQTVNNIVGKVSNTLDGNMVITYSDAKAIAEFVANSDETAGVMLIASIVFGVFAVCLMYSYIFSSVRSKRKSIGIIRGLGARPRDVLRVFLLEAIMISVLIVLGSFITIALAATIANVMVQVRSAYSIVLFNLDAMFFLTIFAATVAVIFACYVVPAMVFARHKRNKGLIKDIQALSEN